MSPYGTVLTYHRQHCSSQVRYLIDIVLLRVPDGGQVQDVSVELGGHVIDIYEALGHADVLVHRPAVPWRSSAKGAVACCCGWQLLCETQMWKWELLGSLRWATSNDRPPDVAGRCLKHAGGFSDGGFLLPWVSAVPGLSHGEESIRGLCGRKGLDRAPGALAGRALCCT